MEGKEQQDIQENKTPRTGSWKSWLGMNGLLNNLPFLLFLSALAIFYIWNGHDAEKKQKEMNRFLKN